jgi:deoxycytidine triphosphate deaminase
MGLLNDKLLDARLGSSTPLASGISRGDMGRWNSRIQPASIDLSIGQIYIPGTPSSQPGSHGNGLKHLLLYQGQTAVVETAEELVVPGYIAGIGFPPASVSMQGILMTNPGHVDPGYKGIMRFTVINIAKEPYELRAGALICTLLFLSMEQHPSLDYANLDKTGQPAKPSLDAGLLRVLSHDFMDIDERAETKANAVVEKIDLRARYRQIGIPVITAVIAAIATLGVAVMSPLENVKERLIKLEEKASLSGVKGAIENLTVRMSDLENKVSVEIPKND